MYSNVFKLVHRTFMYFHFVSAGLDGLFVISSIKTASEKLQQAVVFYKKSSIRIYSHF